ncbi:pirin family protein [Niveispirillum fermenti]|uniref:pirin family protein n=1 Tax=Niveispirillum fermenti TaxID=1233113 RepID=UPI003A85087A
MSVSPDSPIELVVVPKSHDVGGFEVRRALPTAKRRMVGPFIFWDQMGPGFLPAGTGLDVRPHPHIGLSTVTYLTEGEIMHRDSLGSVQAIRPGAVNWMTAGRGIAHSERTEAGLRAHGNHLAGFQSWVALPQRFEEIDPGFVHYPSDGLPIISDHGVWMRLIAGELFGETSPVRTLSETIYLEILLDAGARLEIPASHPERALYLADGRVDIAGDIHMAEGGAGQLLVLREGDALTVRAECRTRLLLLGGEPMDGSRYIWWNFVSSSKERIEDAKADWRNGRFAAVPGETEFIPLPE